MRWLERGIALNTDNAALNADMQRIIDRVKDLPATAANAEAQVKADEEPQSHLFLNAYTGGKVH